MRRQVIVTDWANGAEPRVAYVDEGPSMATSRPREALLANPPDGRNASPGTSGGRVKHTSITIEGLMHERRPR